MRTLYALLWRSHETDETFAGNEFQQRIPRLMQWLKRLYSEGVLVACGGGGFEQHSGGLTIVSCDTIEQALELATQSPMNEIGATEVLVWDVYFANLMVTENQTALERGDSKG